MSMTSTNSTETLLDTFTRLNSTLRNTLMKTPSLGQYLKELREAKGLDLKTVSEGICSSEYLQKVEDGIERPTELCLTKLVQKLGLTSITDLLEDTQRLFNPVLLARLRSIDPVLLGHRLRSEREGKGFPPEALSIMAGCPESFLSAFETGTRRPSIKMLESLAAQLGQPVSYFLREG